MEEKVKITDDQLVAVLSKIFDENWDEADALIEKARQGARAGKDKDIKVSRYAEAHGRGCSC